MKKVVNILTILYILIFFYLTKDINILPLTISISMYFLFSSIFSTTSIQKVIGDLHNEKKYYLRNKTFNYTVLSIILIGIILIIISYLAGDILNIEKLNIINIFMTMSLISRILLNVIGEYLNILGYKKISTNIMSLYNMIIFTINIILSILLFKVFKLNNYINFIILYSVSIIIFIVIIILLYTLLKTKKNPNKNKKEKINYINNIKNIIVNNPIETIHNIIKSTYIYTSIIIIYYILINKYGYNYEMVGITITNTYIYGIIIIYLLHKIIDKYLNLNYENIKETFNSSINKILKISLNTSILLIIISIPLNNIIFNSSNNIISTLVPLLLFYNLYNYIINICIKYIKNKNTKIILIISILIKLIFEIPLINSIYRMGFSLILGSTLSIVLGLIISIILGVILIKNKFKIISSNNFNNILNIIYESIIYTLVLVLLTLVIKIETTNIIDSILVIVFYIFITILFHIFKIILTKK